MNMKNTNNTDSHALRALITAAQAELAAASDADTREGLELHIEELEQDFQDVQAEEDAAREAAEQE